jgi:predicted dehydrogenase
LSWRAAIVGLGQIGLQSDLTLDAATHVYSHARAFISHPAFTLVAGVDSVLANRRMLEQHYGVPAFEQVADLAQLSPDVVAISVPTTAHEAVLEQVLQHCRPRVILCEKPLSYGLAASRNMVQSCQAAGVALYVNYVRRADPAVTEVRQRLQDGRIVGPVKGVCWYSKGVHHNGSHFVDLLQYWLGPVAGQQLLQPGRRLAQDGEPDFLLRFAGVEVLFLAVREEDFSHYTVELVARNGRLRYDLGGEKVWWQGAISAPDAPGYVVLDPHPAALPADLPRIQWHVAAQLARALDGESSSLCSADQALSLAGILHSICPTESL